MLCLGEQVSAGYSVRYINIKLYEVETLLWFDILGYGYRLKGSEIIAYVAHYLFPPLPIFA